jgi:hypothetical protein
MVRAARPGCRASSWLERYVEQRGSARGSGIPTTIVVIATPQRRHGRGAIGERLAHCLAFQQVVRPGMHGDVDARLRIDDDPDETATHPRIDDNALVEDALEHLDETRPHLPHILNGTRASYARVE